jgi:hypothetical protein
VAAFDELAGDRQRREDVAGERQAGDQETGHRYLSYRQLFAGYGSTISVPTMPASRWPGTWQ